MPEVFSKKKKKNEVVASEGWMVDEIKKFLSEGIFSSHWGPIVACPHDTKFEAQNGDEKVLLLMRSHPITNFWWIALSCILVGMPMFWGEFPLISEVSPVVQLGLGILWYLGLTFFVMENFLLWFYNVYIVTDERVIDVDFFGLLYKNINATQIRKIQDVNYSQVGIFSSFFNYGNVVIETSSEQRSADRSDESSPFTFSSVANPERVVRVISELMEQEEKEEYEGRVR